MTKSTAFNGNVGCWGEEAEGVQVGSGMKERASKKKGVYGHCAAQSWSGKQNVV